MKEPNWDDSIEISRDYLETPTILPDEDDLDLTASESTSIKKSTAANSRMTDLRRRIEERLDSKRIAHEMDFDEFDERKDKLQ